MPTNSELPAPARQDEADEMMGTLEPEELAENLVQLRDANPGGPSGPLGLAIP
jgi:hypothetical protein